MPHYETRVSENGSIEIPQAIREKLSLKPNDRVDFYLDDDTRIVRMIARNRSIKNLKGLFKVPPGEGPVDIEAAIGKHLSEKHERIKKDWAEWAEFEAWRKSNKRDAAE